MRRRETPRGGRGSRTTPPPATAPGDGRRRTNRSPDAAATGVQAQDRGEVAPGRSTASRGPPTTASTAWSVPRWRRSARAAGAAASPGAERDEDASRGDDLGSAVEDQAAPRSRPRRRRVAAPSGRHRTRSTRRAVDLDLADARPRRRRARRAARRRASIRPPRSVPVTTVAAALDREDPVDREPRPVGRDAAPRRRDRAAQRRRAPPGRRRSPRPSSTRRPGPGPGQGRPRQQAPDRSTTSPRRARLDHVGLRDDRQPVVDAERIEQLEMLERLGARPVVGRDDEHRRIDLAGADEHVADQPVVPGHVDEVDARMPSGSARWA